MNRSIKTSLTGLSDGSLKSRDLIEQCLAEIDSAGEQGTLTFLSTYADQARAQADWVDTARAKGWALPPCAGIPISVKDLFDVAGETTRAGSHALDHEAPCAADATIVARLKAAGFIIIGKTNMSEFAFSGLGRNAHYGTPATPFDEARIPGGSSSGSAVSVARGMAMGTMGTDTGGSCRIPAAFCGIVGFKPTSARVSQQGVIPLSTSLDSVGPLTNTVEDCALLDGIIADADVQVEQTDFRQLRFGAVQGIAVDRLDDRVANAYDAAIKRLVDAGHHVEPIALDLPEPMPNPVIVGSEALAWHRARMADHEGQYDPWVFQRISAASNFSAADYVSAQTTRMHAKARIDNQIAHLDGLVLPTVQIVPPTFEELEDGEQSRTINMLCLNNTSIGNLLDLPSISIPCQKGGQRGGELPVGFMVMGLRNSDSKLFAMAASIESLVRGV